MGTTGSGKTTLAAKLSGLLGLQHVEFDYYRFGASWVETPDAELRETLRKELAAGSRVSDGNCTLIREVVWPRIKILIWLDYPIGIVLWRLFKRTLLGAILRNEQCTETKRVY